MVQEYVHWMTYWIVLAAVTLAEEVADLLLAFWLPLYYEVELETKVHAKVCNHGEGSFYGLVESGYYHFHI